MHWRIQDFPDEGRASSHEFGAKTCYLLRFSVENCMKMKEIGLTMTMTMTMGAEICR